MSTKECAFIAIPCPDISCNKFVGSVNLNDMLLLLCSIKLRSKAMVNAQLFYFAKISITIN